MISLISVSLSTGYAETYIHTLWVFNTTYYHSTFFFSLSLAFGSRMNNAFNENFSYRVSMINFRLRGFFSVQLVDMYMYS